MNEYRHLTSLEVEDIQLPTVVEYYQLLNCPPAIIHLQLLRGQSKLLQYKLYGVSAMLKVAFTSPLTIALLCGDTKNAIVTAVSLCCLPELGFGLPFVMSPLYMAM